MTFGITLMQPALELLSPSARAEILSIVTGRNTEASWLLDGGPAPETEDAGSPVEDDNFVDFSPQQAKRFLEGCSDKSKRALRLMVSGNRKFKISAVAEELGVKPKELVGLWGGLTKRTRTISQNKIAYLLYWADDAEWDENQEYRDQTGYMTPTTYASFRHALGIA